MLPFRQLIFWAHLIAGVLAGILIAIMSITGAALAFEKQIVAWAERDVRQVDNIPTGAPRLPLDDLLERARKAAPEEARPMSIVVASDPKTAVAVTMGRDAYYVNPYTGEVRRPATTRTHDFLHVLEDWHRFLALSGGKRPVGKVINGVANIAFFVLAVTGLYIWWPRRWEWRFLRPAVWFTRGQSGKARDWNWHNVAGLWMAPVFIVLTLTAVPISFRWASNSIYQIFGETPPAQPGPVGASGPAMTVPPPQAGATRATREALFARVQQESPAWETVTFRLGGGRGAGQPAGSASGSLANGAPTRAREGSQNPPAVQPVTVAVLEKDRWPSFASVTYSLDPYTAGVLKKETLADATPARRFRSWTRFLHTGEALGYTGQFIAMIACLAGVLLVYTGFALSWRRFFGKSTEKA